MKNYKINFIKNTITMSAEFTKAANDTESDEYKLLKKVQTDYPAMTVTRKTHRSPKTCNKNRGLTYANMERFMSVYANAEELKARFEEVKKLAAAQTNSYFYVKSWFITQFPDYKKIPDFTTINRITEVKPAPLIKEENKAA